LRDFQSLTDINEAKVHVEVRYKACFAYVFSASELEFRLVVVGVVGIELIEVFLVFFITSSFLIELSIFLLEVVFDIIQKLFKTPELQNFIIEERSGFAHNAQLINYFTWFLRVDFHVFYVEGDLLLIDRHVPPRFLY
jgi:hypothetical protein